MAIDVHRVLNERYEVVKPAKGQVAAAIAKHGPIDIDILREQAPADYRIAGLSHSSAVALHNEARDLATARLQQLLGRFESTLRERASP